MQENNYSYGAARYAQRPSDAGTDSLVFRFLESHLRILRSGCKALDAGCGAGRSTRFLKKMGFVVTGLDIREEMLEEARRRAVDIEFFCYTAGSAFPFAREQFALVFSSWAVLEIPTIEMLQHFMREAARVLRSDGILYVVTNTPEFYQNRWVSCEVDFPQNRTPLRSGQSVVARLLPEGVVVHDYFWADEDYRTAFEYAGLTVQEVFYPLAPAGECGWEKETQVAPYVIYELARS